MRISLLLNLKIKILVKLKELKAAESELIALFKNYIPLLTKKEINRFSDEHRVWFLIQEDSILKENLMMKGIPLVEYEMIQQIFLESASFYYEILETKEEIKFDPRYKLAKIVKFYYENLFRIRSVKLFYYRLNRYVLLIQGTFLIVFSCLIKQKIAI